MWKWISIGLVVLVIFLFNAARWYGGMANERVMDEIRNSPDSVRAAESMIVTFGDRTLPVNFLWEGDTIYMGIDGLWWREFREGDVPVTLFVRGQEVTGRARVELEDQAFIDDIFSRLRPTVPEWLPDWANGKLVIIELDDA